jgi:cellulose synthase/poly-beta-1,6-N-acetylglucosamine synthase-like glycosyltransferase
VSTAPPTSAEEAEFYRQVAGHAGLPFVRLEQDGSGEDEFRPVDPDAAVLLSETVCRHFTMLLIAVSADAATLAISSPTDDLAVHAATALTGLEIQPVIVPRGELERAINAIFSSAPAPSAAPPVNGNGHVSGEANGHSASEAAAEAVRSTRAELELGAILVAHGAVSEQQITAALLEQQHSGGRVGEILLHAGAIDETTLVEAVAQQLQLPVVDMGEVDPDPAALARLPEPLMRAMRVVPIAVDDTTLYLAVAEPLTPESLARVREYTTLQIRPFLATKTSIDLFLQQLFRDAYIDTATNDMARRLPEDSANRVITPAQKVWLGALVVIAVVAVVVFPVTALIVVLAICSAVYAAVSFYKVYLTYTALGHEYELDITAEEVAAVDDHTLPIYTILVPVYKEAEVIPQLAAGIGGIDYPKHLLDVRLLTEEDDLETIEAIRMLNLPPHFKLVIVPESQPRTKPKACNYGLLQAEGKYTVIYDAEDEPDPDQLKRAVIAFEKADSAVTCIQAKLNYFNREQNLLTRWFSIEYSLWFDLILPGLDAQNVPIPLGGTSNHFVTARLIELGAWDPFNVTEDADLGIRLHKAGYKTAIIDSTTLEEANSEVKNWINQRSRWIKGYFQTWLVHMRHPLRLLRELGPKSFVSFNLIIGGTVIFLMNPVFWLLSTLFFFTHAGLIEQLFPGVVFYASSILMFLGNFIFVYLNVAGAVQRRHFSLTKAALVSPLYWGLMSFAAWKGFIQLFTNPFYWEKTQHGLSGAQKSN